MLIVRNEKGPDRGGLMKPGDRVHLSETGKRHHGANLHALHGEVTQAVKAFINGKDTEAVLVKFRAVEVRNSVRRDVSCVAICDHFELSN